MKETIQRKAFNQISQSAIYREDNISVSVTCCGGSYGGGSEVLIVAIQECKDTESLDAAGDTDSRQ